jgi:hypothetical protein
LYTVEAHSKLSEFLEIFRAETRELSEEERGSFQLNDFFEPCQMLFISFKGQGLQYLIVTHDESRPDKEIKAIDVLTWEVEDTLEELLKDKVWDRELSEEERQGYLDADNYRDLIESAFVFVVSDLRRAIFQKPYVKHIGSKQHILKRDFVWEIWDIGSSNPREMVSDVVEECSRRPTLPAYTPEQITPKVKPDNLEGFGAYFYPPLFVGQYSKPTFRERLWGRGWWPKKVCDLNYKGCVVILNEDGYVLVCGADREAVRSYLNEIMGTGLLLGLPAYAVRDMELGHVTINSEHGIVGMSMIPRGYAFREHDSEITDYSKVRTLNSLTREGAEKLVEEAAAITGDPYVSQNIALLIESYTCLRSSEYVSSFVISWTILERYLDRGWKRYLKGRKIGGERFKKLTGSDWGASTVIESMNLVGLLSGEDYSLLTALRRKRNEVVHEGVSVSLEEASKCYERVFSCVLEDAEIGLSVEDFSEYLTQIDPWDTN